MGAASAPPDMAELESLQPGDMVFAKLGTYPWWPATIALCFQAKFKNKFRVGTDPANSRFWVQFFNENSGAFVSFKNTRVFKPDEASQYLIKATAPLHEKQKTAIDMAVTDYYRINPDASKGTAVDDPPSVPSPTVATPTAKVSSVKSSDASKSTGGKTKRKRSSKLSKVEESPKPKKPRKQIPVVTDTEDEESEPDMNQNIVEENGRSSAIDDTNEEPKRVPRRSNVRPPAHMATEPHPDSVALHALRRAMKDKDAELARKSELIRDLQAKIEKLKAKTRPPEQVRILLPQLPSDLPVVVPSKSEQAVEELCDSAFFELVSDLETSFDRFERECAKAQGADEAMTSAAKEALTALRPLHQVVKEASESVLASELKVEQAFRKLFYAKVPARFLAECNAGKLVNKIARRCVANSKLLTGLAKALRESWVELLKTDSGSAEGGTGSRSDGHSERESRRKQILGESSVRQPTAEGRAVSDTPTERSKDERQRREEPTGRDDTDAESVDDEDTGRATNGTGAPGKATSPEADEKRGNDDSIMATMKASSSDEE